MKTKQSKQKKVKRKNVFLLAFFSTIVTSTIITYSVLWNLNNSKINTKFFNNNDTINIKINSEDWKKESKNLFENKSIFYYSSKKYSISFIKLDFWIWYLKINEPKFDFSKIKEIIKNIRIKSLSIYDLFYFQRIASMLEIEIDQKHISKMLSKNWKEEECLLTWKSSSDLEKNLLITHNWSDYLINNENPYIEKIKEKIRNMMSNIDNYDFNIKKYILFTASKLRIPMEEKSNSITNFYNDWKSKIDLLKTDKTSLIFDIKFLLSSTNFYFNSENINLKKEIIKILNNLNDEEILCIVKKSHRETWEEITKNEECKISEKFIEKQTDLIKKQIAKTYDDFSVEPDVKKTYYALQILKNLKKDVPTKKIIRLISESNQYVNRLFGGSDSNKWSEEMVYNEKIKKMVGYERNWMDKGYIKMMFARLKNRDLDYYSILNLLEILSLNNVSYIPKDFFNQIKEMILSYNDLKGEHKKSFAVYLYMIDKVVNLNLIDDKILLDSITWILNNIKELNNFYKNVIYNFLLTLEKLKNLNIKKEIKKLILLNKEKILNSENNKEETFFIDSLLKAQFEKLEKIKNNDQN